MTKPQILIVEDDRAISNFIAATLDTQNYQYQQVKTGIIQTIFLGTVQLR